MMERRPRAPVSRSSALLAIACSESSANTSSTSSKLKKRRSWRTRAFLGSVRIWTRSLLRELVHRRDDRQQPMNSGISP